jgi:hypothetical protein
MTASKRSLLAALAALSIANPAAASRDAGLPGAFMTYGAGARPLSMGRAFTAVSDDVDAIFWNPAGLATFRSNQIALQHAPLPLGGAYQSLAYAQPLYNAGHIGIGILNLTSGNIDKIGSSAATFDVPIGSFDQRETGYLFSYANRVRERWDVGGTLKMAENIIDGKSERGFGADAGTLYRVNERFTLGASVINLLRPVYSFASEKEKFPALLRTGGALKFFSGQVTTALDIDKTIGSRRDYKWHWGIEGYAIKNIILRMGLEQNEYSAGVGIRWSSFQLDYGAGFQELGFMNRVSIKFVFGGYEVDAKAKPSVFSPVGLINKTTFHVSTRNRSRIVKWVMTIRSAKNEVIRSFSGFNVPPTQIEWDGKDAAGALAPAGTYTYRMSVTDTKDKTELTPTRTLRIVAPTPFEIEAK